MRKWLLVEFGVLKTARLQMVKRCHPIRSDPGRFLSGDGARRGLSSRFKHVLKLSTVLCWKTVAEQFSRPSEDRHQQTAKNCGDETDTRESKSKVHDILSSRIGSNLRAISLFTLGKLSAELPTSLQLGSAEKGFQQRLSDAVCNGFPPLCSPDAIESLSPPKEDKSSSVGRLTCSSLSI